MLLYDNKLSSIAKQRLSTMKNTNDGFIIAEEDMKLRGFGDVLGYQQSGEKEFRIADPVHHSQLFNFAELNIKKIETEDNFFAKYEQLLELYGMTDKINEINS